MSAAAIYQVSNYGVRDPSHVPAYTDTTERRRSMNIEDMLNPSDDITTREQLPQSPRSYKAARSSKPGPLSHRAKASARSQGGSRPPPRVSGVRGPGSPEIPSRTRAFRPGYTDEQELFIWYLRIDVRICHRDIPIPGLIFGASRHAWGGSALHFCLKTFSPKRMLTLGFSSVDTLGRQSPTRTMLASLGMEKSNAEFRDSSANSIESRKPMAFRT